jgi:hypothetical protein
MHKNGVVHLLVSVYLNGTTEKLNCQQGEDFAQRNLSITISNKISVLISQKAHNNSITDVRKTTAS